MGELVTDSFLKAYHGKRVLVTGHTGFKGSWLTLLLKLLGADVMGYALEPESSNGHFQLLGLEKDIHHLIGDVRDLDFFRHKVLEFKPEIIFHLLGISSLCSS